MVKAFYSLIFCTVSLNLASSQWVVQDEGCRTPDRGVGSCVVIYQCQPIIQFLKDAPKPLSPENTQILRSYQCGFQGTNVKVCCPNSPIVPSTFPSPPNVDNHSRRRLVDSCGLQGYPDRIINGNRTGVFEFPWMALLNYQTPSGPDFRCGGTIINKRYILTAAHCLTHLGNLRLIGVRVGDHDVNSEFDCELDGNKRQICAPPPQDVEIEEIIPHPLYNRSAFQNDIGLIRLARDIDLSVDSAKSICLPFGEFSRKFGFKPKFTGVVTGWGATETGRSSPVLLKVSVPTIPNEQCNQVYKRQTTITYKQLCAGGVDRKDSCGGDSGGPLYGYNADGKYVQQGVVSFGPKLCGKEGYPGVYTRVVYFMDWILDTVRT